jgi:hypothetical protein
VELSPSGSTEKFAAIFAPPWLSEAAEIGQGYVTPFDDGLPELADRAEGDLAVQSLAEHQSTW